MLASDTLPRLEEWSRHKVAASHGISLRRVDTVLREAMALCAEHAGRDVPAGARHASGHAAGTRRRVKVLAPVLTMRGRAPGQRRSTRSAGMTTCRPARHAM